MVEETLAFMRGTDEHEQTRPIDLTALLEEAAARPADWVMAGIVGVAGLAPTLTAVRRGAMVALACKESLVCAGDLFIKAGQALRIS